MLKREHRKAIKKALEHIVDGIIDYNTEEESVETQKLAFFWNKDVLFILEVSDEKTSHSYRFSIMSSKKYFYCWRFHLV